MTMWNHKYIQMQRQMTQTQTKIKIHKHADAQTHGVENLDTNKLTQANRPKLAEKGINRKIKIHRKTKTDQHILKYEQRDTKIQRNINKQTKTHTDTQRHRKQTKTHKDIKRRTKPHKYTETYSHRYTATKKY